MMPARMLNVAIVDSIGDVDVMSAFSPSYCASCVIGVCVCRAALVVFYVRRPSG